MEQTINPFMSPLRASEQIHELALALASAQGEFPTIAKTKQGKVKGENKQGRAFEYTYAYADIADVLAGVLPVLAKHKLAVLQPTIMDRGNIVILTRLVHGSGQWLESEYPVCAIGADHQKMGGALTYSRRYALCTLLGIAADEDTDGEHAAAPNGDTQQRREPPRHQQQARPKQEPQPSPELSPAEEIIEAIKARPSIASLDKLWQNQNFKREYSLLNPEDQAWVKSVDESKRRELEADNDPTAMPEAREPAPAKQQGKAAQLVDDEIPF